MAVYLLLSARAHLLDQPEKYSVIWAKETKSLLCNQCIWYNCSF